MPACLLTKQSLSLMIKAEVYPERPGFDATFRVGRAARASAVEKKVTGLAGRIRQFHRQHLIRDTPPVSIDNTSSFHIEM